MMKYVGKVVCSTCDEERDFFERTQAPFESPEDFVEDVLVHDLQMICSKCFAGRLVVPSAWVWSG